MNYVVDTSALICLLAKEKGWEKVKTYFEGTIYMSSVNLAEFYSWCNRKNFDLDEAQETLEHLGISFEEFAHEDAYQIGALFGYTSKFGLSLGDRACLVLGKNLDCVVVTADKA
ncbi:MAG: type II toxin-antitoxin system VapC family toxin [Patescibacteria group bacterium]